MAVRPRLWVQINLHIKIINCKFATIKTRIMEKALRSEHFKKAILLIGSERSGKSRLAKLIIKQQLALCDEKDVIIIDGANFRTRSFMKSIAKRIAINTKLIYIDDLRIRTNLRTLLPYINDGIVAIDENGETTIVYPQIMITANAKMLDIPKCSFFVSHFDIFEIKKCN